MKSFNSKNFIYDKQLNNIFECNLLNGILNPYKHTKNINSQYSPILHGCVNKRNLINFEYYSIVDVVPQL